MTLLLFSFLLDEGLIETALKVSPLNGLGYGLVLAVLIYVYIEKSRDNRSLREQLKESQEANKEAAQKNVELLVRVLESLGYHEDVKRDMIILINKVKEWGPVINSLPQHIEKIREVRELLEKQINNGNSK